MAALTTKWAFSVAAAATLLLFALDAVAQAAEKGEYASTRKKNKEQRGRTEKEEVCQHQKGNRKKKK